METKTILGLILSISLIILISIVLVFCLGSHKYIKVNLDDEEDHNVLELRWNGEVYEGSFMCMTMTCDYDVERNFTANKTVISSGTARENVIVKRKKSGRPVSMQT